MDSTQEPGGPGPSMGSVPQASNAEGGAAVTDASATAAGARVVGLVLASAQFLMTLDSSVMNVSIASVASDLGTTVTGVQTAITLYTLVMASLMITGGRVGAIIGRRRAFAIGCVIYAAGSLITALAPNLATLLVGWSVLEGIGAALIMPAVVALVAGNFPPARRTAAYGAIAAASAIAIAAGPVIGGAVTTFASWRWVFLGEVVIAAVILLLSRRIADAPPERRLPFDLLGAVLSVIGLGCVVFGVLRSSEWGWVTPKPDGPVVLGTSPVLWLVVGGLFVIWLLTRWEARLESRGGEPLIRPGTLQNAQLAGGLTMFLLQYLITGGIFFVIPLFLSVVLELNALATGLRLLPLSLALLVASLGIPRLWPRGSPRLIVQAGLLTLMVGVLALIGGIDLDAPAGVVLIPLLLVGAGVGALASQLGAVTVSAMPDERSSEVGGLQNTAMNLGTSLGTALIGSVLIGALTSGVIAGLLASPAVPESVKSQAPVALAGGVPFISATQLRAGLEAAGVPPATVDEVLQTNRTAQIDALDAALSVVALIAVGALFSTGRIPRRPPGA